MTVTETNNVRVGLMIPSSNTWWNTEYKLNPLYGTRYALDTIRRDDTERALVSFYGMLAQGFTRNTFNCGEGASLVPLDPRGRLLSLPPNSAANPCGRLFSWSVAGVAVATCFFIKSCMAVVSRSLLDCASVNRVRVSATVASNSAIRFESEAPWWFDVASVGESLR